MSGVADFCACNVAVSASILRSSSATRLSAFFCRFRVGGVVMLYVVSNMSVGEEGPMFTMCVRPLRIACMEYRVVPGRNGPVYGQLGSLNSTHGRTFNPRHESHARGRLLSPADLAEPGVA
jgi:hypothetical protein